MKQTNYIYIYDGGFETLLNLINELIKNNIKPLNIKDENFEISLLDEVIHLELNKNQDLIKKINENLGNHFIKVIYYVYLSNECNKELIIYYLYLNSLKYREKILNMSNLKCVSRALKIARYVMHEAHKIKGFVRFRELENKVLYAEIEPTNNIIEIVSYHFKKRLKNEYWMIKDCKRNIVSIYNKRDFYLIDGNNIKIDTNIVSCKYEDMWKIFYNKIGIKERKNDRCRLNFMPKKYWKNMLEVSDEL